MHIWNARFFMHSQQGNGRTIKEQFICQQQGCTQSGFTHVQVLYIDLRDETRPLARTVWIMPVAYLFDSILIILIISGVIRSAVITSGMMKRMSKSTVSESSAIGNCRPDSSVANGALNGNWWGFFTQLGIYSLSLSSLVGFTSSSDILDGESDVQVCSSIPLGPAIASDSVEPALVEAMATADLDWTDRADTFSSSFSLFLIDKRNTIIMIIIGNITTFVVSFLNCFTFHVRTHLQFFHSFLRRK